MTNEPRLREVETHPLAQIFPLIEGHEFSELVADIKANGLRQPITLADGLILDGRNRYRACRAADIPPEFETFGDGDPLAFVISKNLRRRHLKAGQRALIAARLVNSKLGTNQHRQHSGSVVTESIAAEWLNVSRRSVQLGKIVMHSGAPELIALVAQGALSPSAAAGIAGAAPAKQIEIIQRGTSAVVAEARKRRSLRGRQGRSEYSLLWSVVTEICDGLEARRLDIAAGATAKLAKEIDRVAQSRR